MASSGETFIDDDDQPPINDHPAMTTAAVGGPIRGERVSFFAHRAQWWWYAFVGHAVEIIISSCCGLADLSFPLSTTV